MASKRPIEEILDELKGAGASNEVIAAKLVEIAGGASNAAELVKKSQMASIADKYAAVLRDGVVLLEVKKWPILEAFAERTIAPESSLGMILQDILRSLDTAVESRDAQALIEYLLLLWKAVKRD